MKQIVVQKPLILIIFLFLSFSLKAQIESKKIKKTIPVKGIQRIDSLFSDGMFIYHTKKSKGLWDQNSKRIVLGNLQQVEHTICNINWVLYNTKSEYGVYDVSEKKKLVTSSSPFWLNISTDGNMVNVIGEKMMGFISISENKAYYVNPLIATDTVFIEEVWETVGCRYSAEEKKLIYGYGDVDGYEAIYSLINLPDYIFQDGYFYHKNTGQLILKAHGGEVEMYNNMFIIYDYNATSYYDKDLNIIYELVSDEDHSVKHFQRLVDSNIIRVEYIDDYVYQCKIGSQYQFYYGIKETSELYDFIFPIGYDFEHEGYSFFTVKYGEGYGLFNTQRKEEFKPKYNTIEKRLFKDGSYWLRVDDSLYIAREFVSDSIQTKLWEASMEKESMIIYHLGIKNNKLVISGRARSADTHDSYYYTSTYFDDGSGVIELTDSTWLIKPRYHTITPYKDYYVAMKIGSTYRNASWLQTTIFDKDFKPITDKKLGVSFIYNDMLIARDGVSLNYIIYDVDNNRVQKELGKMNEVDADFIMVDGYLVVVDYNYSRYSKNFLSMDITDIISPEGELIKVPVKRYRFIEMLGEDLVTIGRVPESEAKDIDLHRMRTDAYAIFDLQNRKLITPWCKRIALGYNKDVVHYIETTGQEQISIPVGELRDKFSE